jgi:hypothetical protein
VYDALVWGMVCTILDMRPAILQDRDGGRRGGGGGALQLERRRRRHNGGVMGCC